MKQALLPRSVPDSMALHGNNEPILTYIRENAGKFGGELRDRTKALVNGQDTHWLEYIPSGYQAGTRVPLVLSMHAGGQSSYGQFYDTSWNLVAEHNTFIVVYPDASRRGAWDVSEQGPINMASQDMQAICALIEEMKAQYSIDAGRIYMQGMSMGDLMSMQCGRVLGDVLAGIGSCSGPTNPAVLFSENGALGENKGPVAVFQSRGAFDGISLNPQYSRTETNTKNRDYWREINGCNEMPIIRTSADEMIAAYPGEHADVIYRVMIRHGHYQAVNDAALCWDLVFSRYRRDESGNLCHVKELQLTPDKNAVAVCDGAGFAYVDGKKVPVGGTVHVEQDVQAGPPMGGAGGGPRRPDSPRKPMKEPMPSNTPAPNAPAEISGVYAYVPVRFLETAFGAKVSGDESTASIFCGGKEINVAKGYTGALVDGTLYNLGREPKIIDAQLMVPINFFAETVLNRTCVEKNGVIYIKDGPCSMTDDFSNILREILM